MSLILAILMAMLFLTGGKILNVSPDYMLIVWAIIFAGGLAGLKD